MILRPYYYDDHGCAAYLCACATLGRCAVVDARTDDVEAYGAFANSKGMRITDALPGSRRLHRGARRRPGKA